ncbi:hypothetical protein BpHYR1_024104, partial [Brachionus plicatilis]
MNFFLLDSFGSDVAENSTILLMLSFRYSMILNVKSLIEKFLKATKVPSYFNIHNYPYSVENKFR